MKTILVVDDELKIVQIVRDYLEHAGYLVVVAGDGRTAQIAFRANKPDLVVLDLGLPELDGLDVTRAIRKESNAPIIILTARGDETDKLVGLELGADDYMTKPFSMREFLSRVKAHLRRERLIRQEVESTAETNPKEQLHFGNLLIDLNRREVLFEGQPLALKPKEYELLLFLAQHRGQALSREFLLEHVWGWEFVGGTRTVDVHIHWLREKIEINPSNPQRIITVRGSGYRFEG